MEERYKQMAGGRNVRRSWSSCVASKQSQSDPNPTSHVCLPARRSTEEKWTRFSMKNPPGMNNRSAANVVLLSQSQSVQSVLSKAFPEARGAGNQKSSKAPHGEDLTGGSGSGRSQHTGDCRYSNRSSCKMGVIIRRVSGAEGPLDEPGASKARSVSGDRGRQSSRGRGLVRI